MFTVVADHRNQDLQQARLQIGDMFRDLPFFYELREKVGPAPEDVPVHHE